jgi:NhaP-type Na+/H+ or K+/H+ antiporter
MGAVLAPTDPVLASDVQVGPPLEKVKDNIRFSLTAEAGLNDGMAFPFTWLAIKVALVSGATATSLSWIGEWVLIYLLYKISMGAIIGYLTGRLLAFLLFYLPEKENFIVIKDGFVAISATLLVYGLTELIGGYGFIAVFITAITLRNYEIGHKYHVKLHSFTDQVERILLAIILILFGGSIATGLLDFLTVKAALVGIGFVFIIRPLTSMISLIGTPLHIKEKMAISFYGIRGIGSFFYLAYALHATSFATGREMWSMLGFTVLLSIIVHGFTAATVMKKLEQRFTKPSTIEIKS